MQLAYENIRTYLIAQGFTNIVFDDWKVFLPESNAQNHNQIMIKSEPSSTPSESSLSRLIFGIYVKNSDMKLAISNSNAIANKLRNLGGKLVPGTTYVPFKRIFVDTEPYFYGKSSNNENIYLTRFSCFINNTDIDTIYD
ncbi:MAG: hypothetical protein SGJ02_11700 [bacterium]|nr:hypothetical protein [bacterium]